jgi:hypothetical protein
MLGGIALGSEMFSETSVIARMKSSNICKLLRVCVAISDLVQRSQENFIEVSRGGENSFCGFVVSDEQV